jgi:serine/threonine protein kinase
MGCAYALHMRLPERQARHFFRHLLAALRHAHARGFLHCDVKPANVRLQLGPGEGELTAVLVRVIHAAAASASVYNPV